MFHSLDEYLLGVGVADDRTPDAGIRQLGKDERLSSFVSLKDARAETFGQGVLCVLCQARKPVAGSAQRTYNLSNLRSTLATLVTTWDLGPSYKEGSVVLILNPTARFRPTTTAGPQQRADLELVVSKQSQVVRVGRCVTYGHCGAPTSRMDGSVCRMATSKDDGGAEKGRGYCFLHDRPRHAKYLAGTTSTVASIVPSVASSRAATQTQHKAQPQPQPQPQSKTQLPAPPTQSLTGRPQPPAPPAAAAAPPTAAAAAVVPSSLQPKPHLYSSLKTGLTASGTHPTNVGKIVLSARPSSILLRDQHTHTMFNPRTMQVSQSPLLATHRLIYLLLYC